MVHIVKVLCKLEEREIDARAWNKLIYCISGDSSAG